MKIRKLKTDVGGTDVKFYPVTIPQAVVDPETNETLKVTLGKKADLVEGKIPSSQLPSFVDDVIEVADFASLPPTGEAGKIYVTKDTNDSYRYTGTDYVRIGNPVDFATQAEAEANAENTKAMTSLRVFQNFVKNSASHVFSTLKTTAKTLVGGVNELFDSVATKASHGYDTEETPKTLKQVDESVVQLAGDVSLLDAVQGAKIKDIENILSTANLNQSAKISVSGHKNISLPKNASNGGMSVKMEGLTQDVGGVITHFEPTGRVRSVDKNGINPTALYLTAPELRSNGTVKDEIRKGGNGYELVKRVGVGTLEAHYYQDFEGTPTLGKAGQDEISTFVINTTSPISGTKDARAVVSVSGTNSNRPICSLNGLETVAQTHYKVSFKYKVNSGTCILSAIFFGGGGALTFISPTTLTGSGTFTTILQASQTRTTYFGLGFDGRNVFDIQIDDLTAEKISVTDGVPASGVLAIQYGSNVHYQLDIPTITPITHAGLLNSAENGTVYHEPIIADAGVYGSNLPILNTDYPIASIEEIIKHEGGVDTYLNASTAVIAPDGLSFTHPDLGSGDLVLFTYAFDKESANGNITATFYDSNVVKIDTVTGKAYRINEVVTNGVLTRTLTEV